MKLLELKDALKKYEGIEDCTFIYPYKKKDEVSEDMEVLRWFFDRQYIFVWLR